jgi:signal transduction histidine kinase
VRLAARIGTHWRQSASARVPAEPLMDKKLRVVKAHAPLRHDAILAAAVGVLDLVTFSDIFAPNFAIGGSGIPGAAVVAFASLGYAALAWRRRAPFVVLIVVWLHSAVALLMPTYRPTLGLLVALYTVAALKPKRIALLALSFGMMTASFGILEELHHAPPAKREGVAVAATIFFVGIYLVAYVIGQWVRGNRQQVSDLERRREVAAKEAVAAERSRIARELHDIVAHSVSVMVLQAAGAQRVLSKDPDRATQALGQIETTGKQAMQELRRLLGLLFLSDEQDANSVLGPPSGLAHLDELLMAMRTAGVRLILSVKGEPGQLDPSVDLAAYRVIQEAATCG